MWRCGDDLTGSDGEGGERCEDLRSAVMKSWVSCGGEFCEEWSGSGCVGPAVAVAGVAVVRTVTGAGRGGGVVWID